MTQPEKTVHFVSLGCPKNLVDTEIMIGTLTGEGYRVVAEAQDATTVIVNTCGFVEDSKRESIDTVLELAKLKNSGRLQKLVVAGCLTQRYQDQLVDGLPEADLFVGSGQFQQIGQILSDSEAGNQEKRFFHLPTYLQQHNSPRVNTQPKHRAYLKISEGCKKRCAFCAIPLIRGNLQSRQLDHVVGEAKLLVAGGVKELIIISHDFTDYGWDLQKQAATNPASPVNLLRALSDQSGAQWIRVLYLYPDGVTPEMIALIKERANLVKYFDMPLQHINNEMLKKMNRRMTRQQIEAVLNNIRREIPEAVIRTQFIVGFPGESEEQFLELMDFIKQNKFDRVGCFKYSQEENTKAGAMSEQIDEATKERRYQALMSLQQDVSRDQQRRLIGHRIPVLVEGYSEETELLLQGRHAQQAPEIDGVTYINEGEAQIGEIVNVEITDAHDYDLVGRIAGPAAEH